MQLRLPNPGSTRVMPRVRTASSQAAVPDCHCRGHPRLGGLRDQSRRNQYRRASAYAATRTAAPASPDRGRREVHPRALADPRRCRAQHPEGHPRADLLPHQGPAARGARHPRQGSPRDVPGGRDPAERAATAPVAQERSRRIPRGSSSLPSVDRGGAQDGRGRARKSTCRPPIRRARLRATRSERSAESSGRTSSRRIEPGPRADQGLLHGTRPERGSMRGGNAVRSCGCVPMNAYRRRTGL